MKSFHEAGAELDQSSRWALGPGMDPKARLGCELKTMFDSLTAGPMPDRLTQLADALEEAFHRGELFEGKPGRRF